MPGPPQARSGMTDTTIGTGSHGLPCCPHTFGGIMNTGSQNVFVNGKPATRLFDFSVHFCPHCGVGMVVGASGTVIINGRGAARLGDPVTEFCGSGNITSGSGNVNSGG